MRERESANTVAYVSHTQRCALSVWPVFIQEIRDETLRKCGPKELKEKP